jgi:hypothetical protein
LRQVSNQRRLLGERPQAARPLQATLSHEFVQGAADGDEAAAVLGSQLLLGRNLLAGRPLSGVERSSKVQIRLVMERDRTRLERVATHVLPIMIKL